MQSKMFWSQPRTDRGLFLCPTRTSRHARFRVAMGAKRTSARAAPRRRADRGAARPPRARADLQSVQSWNEFLGGLNDSR
jgi:hypothetical protein